MSAHFELILAGGEERDAERLLIKLRNEKEAAEDFVDKIEEILQDCRRDYKYALREHADKSNNVLQMATAAYEKALEDRKQADDMVNEKTLQLCLYEYGFSTLKRKRDEYVAQRDKKKRNL